MFLSLLFSLFVLPASAKTSKAAMPMPHFSQETADSVGFDHAHRNLNRIHVYESNASSRPKYKSSSVALAVDAHHLISTYLSVSSVALNKDEKIYLGAASGLYEVRLQYVDIFNGLALLYSAAELKNYLNPADIATQPLLFGEKLRIASLRDESLDGMSSVVTDVLGDDIHIVQTLKSSFPPNGNRTDGSLVLNAWGKIVGIYQGTSNLPEAESLTPSSSFLYLLQKAQQNPMAPTDPELIRRQLTSQMEALQTRFLAALEKSTAQKENARQNIREEVLGLVSISFGNYFKCEKTDSGQASGQLTMSCLPRIPILISVSQPALDVHMDYELASFSSAKELSQNIDFKSQKNREFFKQKNLVCSQQKTRLKFAEDSQLHFCTCKSSISNKTYDTLLRGNASFSKDKNLYFEFFLRGLSRAETLETSSLLVNSIKTPGAI